MTDAQLAERVYDLSLGAAEGRDSILATLDPDPLENVDPVRAEMAAMSAARRAAEARAELADLLDKRYEAMAEDAGRSSPEVKRANEQAAEAESTYKAILEQLWQAAITRNAQSVAGGLQPYVGELFHSQDDQEGVREATRKLNEARTTQRKTICDFYADLARRNPTAHLVGSLRHLRAALSERERNAFLFASVWLGDKPKQQGTGQALRAAFDEVAELVERLGKERPVYPEDEPTYNQSRNHWQRLRQHIDSQFPPSREEVFQRLNTPENREVLRQAMQRPEVAGKLQQIRNAVNTLGQIWPPVLPSQGSLLPPPPACRSQPGESEVPAPAGEDDTSGGQLTPALALAFSHYIQSEQAVGQGSTFSSLFEWCQNDDRDMSRWKDAESWGKAVNRALEKLGKPKHSARANTASRSAVPLPHFGQRTDAD